jgi:alpha-amylase
MPSLAIFFRVHQPLRLRKFSSKDIDVCHNYRDEVAEAEIMNRITDECYLPANALLLSLTKQFQGRFRFSFSISGSTLEMMAAYRPDALESFRQLVATGCVEILPSLIFIPKLFYSVGIRTTSFCTWIGWKSYSAPGPEFTKYRTDL